MKSLLPPTWPLLMLNIRRVWKNGPWSARWHTLGCLRRAVWRWWTSAPVVFPLMRLQPETLPLATYARTYGMRIPQELLDQQEGSANLASNQPPPKQEP